MSKNDWIPVEWQRLVDVSNHEITGVSITEMRSPFYPDIRYAVRCGGSVLSRKGKWEYEPQPSSRTDAFYKRCRFTSFDEACAAADKAIAKLFENARRAVPASAGDGGNGK